MKALAGRAATWIAGTGLLDALEATDQRRDRVRIVAYHRIDEPEAQPDLDPGLCSATPVDFRAQMEVVARRYHVIPLDTLVAAHRGEVALPPRAVLLTFDDGYEDFERNAWPVLRELGLPSVLFVPTAFPDVPGPGFWWDRLHAALTRTRAPFAELDPIGRLPLGDPEARRNAHRAIRNHVKRLPHDEAMAWLDARLGELAELPSLHRVLGWDALRKLAGADVRVCSHGHLHALCTRLGPEALARDLETSRGRIEAELGPDAPPPVFAYPAAANDAASRAAVANAGYVLGFAGGRGIDRLPLPDPFALSRIPVHRYTTALFRAQLRPSIARLGSLLVDGRARRSVA